MSGFVRYIRTAILTAALSGALVLGLSASSAGGIRGPSVGPARGVSRIVYATDLLCRSKGQWTECGKGEIAVVRVDGTHYHPLTHNRITEISPAWSADHRRVTFVRQGLPNWTVWVEGKGLKPRNVSRHLPSYRQDPDLSPKGKHVVVSAAGREGPPFHLYLVDVKSTRVTQLTRSHAVYGEQTPAWSPNGKEIAFQLDFEIWVVDVRTHELTQLTFGAAPPSSGSTDPAWSPDSRQIAYHREGGGIWVMNSDGSDPHAISPEGRDPTWSADGNWIVVSIRDLASPDRNGLLAMHPDGSSRRWIVRDEPARIDDEPDG